MRGERLLLDCLARCFERQRSAIFKFLLRFALALYQRKVTERGGARLGDRLCISLVRLGNARPLFKRRRPFFKFCDFCLRCALFQRSLVLFTRLPRKLYVVGEDDEKDEEEHHHRYNTRDERLADACDGVRHVPMHEEAVADSPQRVCQYRDNHPANEVPQRLDIRIAVRAVGNVALQRKVDALRREHRDLKGDKIAKPLSVAEDDLRLVPRERHGDIRPTPCPVVEPLEGIGQKGHDDILPNRYADAEHEEEERLLNERRPLLVAVCKGIPLFEPLAVQLYKKACKAVLGQRLDLCPQLLFGDFQFLLLYFFHGILLYSIMQVLAL